MRLDPELHVTHLKRWTIASVIHTDITCRALPWSRLILEAGKMPDDLNVSSRERVKAIFAFLSIALMTIGIATLTQAWYPGLWLALTGLVLPFAFGLDLFAFFARRAGFLFAAEALCFHQVHLFLRDSTISNGLLNSSFAGRVFGCFQLFNRDA